MPQEQPDFATAPPARYGALPERVRVCLALAAAGLSGLAALSPEAHAAVEGSLSDSMAAGLTSDGELAAFMNNLLDRIRVSGSEAAASQRLEDALIAKALGLSDDQAPAARFG